MPLMLGNVEQKVMLGDIEIDKIMRGDEEIYSSGPTETGWLYANEVKSNDFSGSAAKALGPLDGVFTDLGDTSSSKILKLGFAIASVLPADATLVRVGFKTNIKRSGWDPGVGFQTNGLNRFYFTDYSFDTNVEHEEFVEAADTDLNVARLRRNDAAFYISQNGSQYVSNSVDLDGAAINIVYTT